MKPEKSAAKTADRSWVIGFNTAEESSLDVSEDVAHEPRRRTSVRRAIRRAIAEG